MDTSVLEDLGLTQAEIKTYLTLLELGNSSAGHILEKSGLQNSVMHRALNSLIEKGIISFILQGRRKVYQATDPEHFHTFIDDKRKRFDQILPALQERQKFAKEKTSATIYKGKRGINEVYNTLLNLGGKEYNTFGGGKEVAQDTMSLTWWRNIHAKRIAKKIPARQVFDETVRKFGNELNKKPITNIKFLPPEYRQLQETVIVGDNVGISIFSENPYGILIRDKTVADGYRMQFELLWKLAKK